MGRRQLPPLTGYTFLPRFNKGSSGADGLPCLRVFGELEGANGQKYVRADDIPLEVGTQSRNLKKQRYCSGKTRISKSSSMTSHEWYDRNKGDNDGEYLGINPSNYKPNTRTGMPRCSWCEQVSAETGNYMVETWSTGDDTFNYYMAGNNSDDPRSIGTNYLSTDFLDLKSAAGNDIFNTSGEDYEAIGGETIDFGDGVTIETSEIIKYYKIRLIGGGGLVRELHIHPNDLGQEIPVLDSSTSILLRPFENPCPNEEQFFLTPYRTFYEDYLEREVKELGQESRFLITEQLAYSAQVNPITNTWEARQPPSSYIEQKGRGIGLIFTSAGIPSQDWNEGNRDSITPQGNKPRFPEPKMGRGTAATIITPYADNRMVIPLQQYHILKEVGRDVEIEIDEASGREIMRKTPYYYCPQCNDSFHGAPTNEDANIWKFPEPTGNEVFKNGWDIDPNTDTLVFKESDVETERRNDGGGGYNPKSDWHWTLPLYTENKPFGTWLDDALINNPKMVEKLNFTRIMTKWLKNNKTFTEVEKDE